MTDPKDGKEVRKGGFGQFAEQYRARWAARHPNAPLREPGATTTEPAAPAPPDATSE